MDASIIVAAIGGLATLAAPFVGVVAAQWSKNRELNRISSTRRQALQGYWVGTGTQEVGPGGSGPFATKISATLKAGTKTISGQGTWEYEIATGTVTVSMSFTGGFLYERYVRLDYNNQKAGVINFGSAILMLSSSGRTLTGRFVGYGSATEDLISGSIELKKQP